MEALAKRLGADCQTVAHTLADLLGRGVGGVWLEIQVCAVDPTDTPPLWAPLRTIVLTGTDLHLAPAPGPSTGRRLTLRVRDVGLTTDQRGPQELQEATGGLAGLLV